MIPMNKAMRLARMMRGMPQTQLADRASISDAYLSVLERGKAFPTVLIVSDLASVLGLSLEEYLGLRPPEERSDMQEQLWELCWTCVQDISANVTIAEAPAPKGEKPTHKCRLCGDRAVQWYRVRYGRRKGDS